MPEFTAFIPALCGAIFGFLLKYIYDKIAIKRRFKQELEDNDHIDVTGEWYAAWQTSVDGQELLNSEHLKMEQKGKTLRIWNTERSPENPKAGYLWEGQMQFLQGRNVMGWYFSKKQENNASKGMLYLTYLSQRKQFFGKWVGTAYDGELVNGYVVISKDRSSAMSELASFVNKHPQELQLIAFSGID